jgi:peptidoglycan hydrolase-like protein with peptidoglycan-binding domain
MSEHEHVDRERRPTSNRDQRDAALAPRAPDGGDVPAVVHDLQQTIGNAATVAVMRAWKQAMPPPPLPPEAPPPPPLWAKVVPPEPGPRKNVLGVVPRVPHWAKAQPPGTGGTIARVVKMGAQRGAPFQADMKVQAEHKVAEAASLDADKAQIDAAREEASALVSEQKVTPLLKTATNRSKIAAGFWTSEEPFAGEGAAKAAEVIDKHVDSANALVLQVKTNHQAAVLAEAAAKAAVVKITTAETNALAATIGIAPTPESLVSQQKIAAFLLQAKGKEAAATLSVKNADQAITDSGAKVKDMEKVQTDTWKPLKVGGGPEVIIGRLQQQLNATRAGGAERVSITAYFTTKTETLLKTFQSGGTGVADSKAWGQLDVKAPAVRQAGKWVVKSPEGASPMGTTFKGDANFEGLTRPVILPTVTPAEAWIAVDRGPAVIELQQRLNNWAIANKIGSPLRVDGRYGSRTGKRIKEFQNANGLNADGAVLRDMWALLDKAAGPVTEGMAVRSELTEVEGQERGQLIKYVWSVSGSELRIAVKINFVPQDPRTLNLTDVNLKKDKKDPTKVDRSEVSKLQASMRQATRLWVNDIKRVWNGFTATDTSPATKKKKPVKIVFDPRVVSGSGDATVEVLPGPIVGNEGGRSDSGHWFASDPDGGLAPHEFGHLIGLPDEYALREETFVTITGTEAPIGDVTAPQFGGSSPAAHAQYIANAIGAAVAVPDGNDPADPAKQTAAEEARGKIKAFAQAVNDLGMDQNGYTPSSFARAVSEEFADDATAKAVSGGMAIVPYVVSLLPKAIFDMSDAKEASVIWALQSDYESPIRVFLSTNQTIMGTMESLPARGKTMPKGHEHPVQPRHLQVYMRHLDGAYGGSWKVK